MPAEERTSKPEKLKYDAAIDRFAIYNFSYHPDSLEGHMKVMGEVGNLTDSYFKYESFRLTFYDAEGNLLDTTTMLIQNIEPNSRKAFKRTIEVKAKPHHFKFQLD